MKNPALLRYVAALLGVEGSVDYPYMDRAYETTLAEGVLFERRVFHSLFSTEDQKEGMAAFLEKREPQFRDK